jgi:glycosyltransferase involved in cell wall biosynthesis
MRIGVDCRELYQGRRTGIGRHLRSFLTYVARSAPQHELVLFGDATTESQITGTQLSVRVLPQRPRLWWDHITLSHAVRQAQIDVFFSPFHKAPLLTGIPTIVVLHSVYPFVYDVQRPRAMMERWHYRIMMRSATAIAAVSAYVRDIATQRHVLDPAKCVVIHNCASPVYQPGDQVAALQVVQQQFPRVRPGYMLYVGNLNAHKNVPGMIRAYAGLAPAVRALHQLVIVGSTDNATYPMLKQLVHDLQVTTEVIFTDVVAEEQLLAHLYNAARAFLTVSFEEGCNVPTIEAISCGTPVIAAAITPLQEALGEAAWWVDPQHERAMTQALMRLVDDDTLHAQLRARGLVQARRYTWDAIGQRNVALCEQVGRGACMPGARA